MVVEPDCGRVVEQRRPEARQEPIADVEGLAGVEQVHPVDRHRALGRHDAHAGERGDQSGLRRRVEQVEQAAGVVAVGMGQPDPADVCRVDH